MFSFWANITDINHLAGAIPYCDVVVCDKDFAHLSKERLRLDAKYECTILSKLEELDKFI